ncbi:hypothetical protein HGG64_02165 [Mycoplasma phocoeninasale]|uniref:Uncharacterized protein n=1 Tax=Mycoplasma phocoeninasale TaxID=2726117 RepID=A0A858U500_9MOLU|nr:hypothetical protein [Mycoplasma phocoeninasale]QJG66497.1 hypothetical protein HGG64_02165 [Mycoplasma phocoeninasale]
MKNKIHYVSWDINLISESEMKQREKRWQEEFSESEAIFIKTMKKLVDM